MMTSITQAAHAVGLLTMGATHSHSPQTQTVVLFGTGPDFWPVFSAAPESDDGAPDPIDRWSKRVITALAAQFEATCQFPSDGPPYPPFIRWALASGRFFQSPVGMMVHPDVGLLISLRGALLFDHKIDLEPTDSSAPCDSCLAPCTTACPVGALRQDAPYDVAACHAYLDTNEGVGCMTGGCLARRACPVSAKARRPDAQSALHMRSFHP